VGGLQVRDVSMVMDVRELAAEVLCNGLSRDPHGRSAFAHAGGLPMLALLLASSAPKVQLCAAAVLSLYR
jgi:hypothetical protein